MLSHISTNRFHFYVRDLGDLENKYQIQLFLKMF